MTDNYARIQLLDASGRLIIEQVNNWQCLVQLNLTVQESGVYLLWLENEKESQTAKLIISNKRKII